MTTRGARLLAKWRAGRALSQTSAAKMIGVDQGRYGQYERGTTRPGRKHAARIYKETGGFVAFTSWDEEDDEERQAKAS